MTNNIIKTSFLSAAEAWVCDGYALDIRFLANLEGSSYQIWDAAIALNPLRAERDTSFQIESNGILVGHIQSFPQRKKSLIALLSSAAEGALTLEQKRLALPGDSPVDLYSEMVHSNRWFSPLHLRVGGNRVSSLSSAQLMELDNALRRADIPFDGLSDVAGWLGLTSPMANSNPPSISIHVGPPVDLILEECSLVDDQFNATLHAHPKFNVQAVGLAISAVPGVGLEARQQISGQIKWGRVRDGRRVGTANVTLRHADNVLAMLMIGPSTVRRQWFVDSTRARNNRFLAIQHFDKDLRMVRNALLDSQDSSKFEQGVAALLFLLGFSPVIQLETDAPDLVVTTPGGKLAVVECTTRIADFASKVGKLVDRRGALSKSLESSGHPALVSALLVCRLPRDQIAAQSHELSAHGTLLATREDLESSLERVRYPNDPDRMLDELSARFNSLEMRLNG